MPFESSCHEQKLERIAYVYIFLGKMLHEEIVPYIPYLSQIRIKSEEQRIRTKKFGHKYHPSTEQQAGKAVR